MASDKNNKENKNLSTPPVIISCKETGITR
jgi:hypothetical protein